MQELIVGVLERLSLASGKEVMPYLLEKEKNFAWDLGLDEGGNMGHIVPGHKIILKKVIELLSGVNLSCGVVD